MVTLDGSFSADARRLEVIIREQCHLEPPLFPGNTGLQRLGPREQLGTLIPRWLRNQIDIKD
jgi:hypothetical protein